MKLNTAELKSYLIIALGLAIYSFGWTAFLIPSKVIGGGVSGIGTLILSIVYYITDVKEISFGSVFKYVGMNAITVYFLSMFIGKIFELISVGQGNSVHSYLFETLFVHDLLPIQLSSMLYALIVTGFYLFLGYFMYKRKIFIKV